MREDALRSAGVIMSSKVSAALIAMPVALEPECVRTEMELKTVKAALASGSINSFPCSLLVVTGFRLKYLLSFHTSFSSPVLWAKTLILSSPGLVKLRACITAFSETFSNHELVFMNPPAHKALSAGVAIKISSSKT